MFEEVPIANITLGERFRKDLGDIEGLAASIQEHGLLHPIVVSSAYGLIVGQRRLAACQSLGWQTISALVLDLDNPLSAEFDENDKRLAFAPSERVQITEAMRAHE